MNEDIKLEYMHLCDFASPAINGKVNLIGVFDSFSGPKPNNDFYIVAKIVVAQKKTEYKISFEIQSKKDGVKIFTDEKPMTISNTPLLNFNILKLMKNIDFKDFGEYIINVLVNGLPIGYKQIEVKKPEVTTIS